jgi:hypothetical protein
VAIVLMDSRGPDGKRAEGGDRSKSPRDDHERIETPGDETDEQRAQRAKGDQAQPEVAVLDLGRKLEHLSAEPSSPSFLGALAPPERQLRQPFHRVIEEQTTHQWERFAKYPDLKEA